MNRGKHGAANRWLWLGCSLIGCMALLYLCSFVVRADSPAAWTISGSNASPWWLADPIERGATQIVSDTASTSASPDGVKAQIYLPVVKLGYSLDIAHAYPVNGAQGVSLNTFFTWDAQSVVVTPIAYEIYLDADVAVPHTLLAVTNKPSLDPPTLELNRRYAWQLIVIDSTRIRWTGPIWTFQTEGVIDPPALGSMVTVPAGEFQMGCDLAIHNNPRYPCLLRGRPMHKVYLDAYAIDKYEVTNQEYRACVQARRCNPPRRYSSPQRPRYFDNALYNLFPVIYVSWWDAFAYCGWVGKRLPTEAEWEKAARGPIDTRTWVWGDEPPNCTRTNYFDGCGGDSTRVGSYPTGMSPYGVMDMSGNVFEWLHDFYSDRYYRQSPYLNPQGPPDGSLFVIRGGSYMDRQYYATVFHRHWGHHGDQPFGDAPYYRSPRVGFRCAKSLP